MDNLKAMTNVLDTFKKFLKVMNDQDLMDKYFGETLDELMEAFDEDNEAVRSFLISFANSCTKDENKLAAGLLIWNSLKQITIE